MKKILIIEDDQFLRDLIERKLIRTGYQVLNTNDGAEGLKMINEEKPALVLLDILLPSMSGWEILEKIKADPAINKIPVLILTNLGEKEDLERGLKMGADDYIIKAHFTPNEIIDKIEKCLNY
ncbi:MAG: response regulator [Candidatus Portnoybacteria bacterium CG23_combo_of_CG06-09_8_20_14_all_37_13]|uniref:Response regulator n=1 Tax=Candidatus Portnoybacteria bacterium CG23_combo_of_CG06-09_8_20_14_all_37_13 TaxID=1974819 RepID=A0A2G9YDG7_9BACT|nr:MAG: response regulator [Candidatus Portnoybacteria bacterium CG23_combo_of_CG06-09_8_20_14_all_37_13]